MIRQGHELKVVEISGHGGNYYFDSSNRFHFNLSWDVLFPKDRIIDLDTKLIKKRLLDTLIEFEPDLIISGALAFPSGAIAINYATSHQTPLIMFDDAKLVDVPRNRLINWIKKQLYSGVDAMFCPSPAWNETFKYFGFSKDRLFYGVNVVDNNFFQKQIIKHGDIRPTQWVSTECRKANTKKKYTNVN